MDSAKLIFKKMRPYFLIMPLVLLFIFLVLIPMLQTIFLSFFDWNMISPEKKFIGFENYRKLFNNPVFYRVTKNTVFYVIILVCINFCIPYIFAFICHDVLKRFKVFYKSSFFLPAFISLVVGSMVFTWILNPVVGPLSSIISKIGIELPVWTKTEGLVIVIISLITSWKVFGYNFIVLYAAVGGVSSEIIEAAMIDKVPTHKIFLNIVLPLSSSSGYYIFIMTIVQGLQYVFTPIETITQGGPNYHSANFIHYSYEEAFSLFKTGTGSAISVITVVIFVLSYWIINQIIGRRVYYEN